MPLHLIAPFGAYAISFVLEKLIYGRAGRPRPYCHQDYREAEEHMHVWLVVRPCHTRDIRDCIRLERVASNSSVVVQVAAVLHVYLILYLTVNKYNFGNFPPLSVPLTTTTVI